MRGEFKQKYDIELPKNFSLYDLKDYYFWYVIQNGIPETIFWDMNISFVEGVVADKAGFGEWLSKETERIEKRNG